MKTTIIIPTYNERENVTKLIPAIFSMLSQISILVVDDNSPDDTAGAVEDLARKYPNLDLVRHGEKAGLGKAYVFAFRKILAEGGVEKIITMDADFSHHPEALPEMLRASQDYDVVIGSRYIAGGKTVGWELWRKFLSTFANIYCRVITGLPVMDCTSGFNLVRIEALQKIDLDSMDSSGYAFQMELKYLLHKNGARFKEIPITFRNRVGGESKMSGHIIREGVIAPWKMWYNYHTS